MDNDLSAKKNNDPGPNPAPTPEPISAPTLEPDSSSQLTPAPTPTPSSLPPVRNFSDEPLYLNPKATDPAPIIIRSDDTSLVPTTTDASTSGLLAGVIVLAVLLTSIVLGNIICFACYRRKKRNSSQLSDNAEDHQGHDSMLYDLESERSRRLKAEAIIDRTKPGGLRISGFPKVRNVLQNLDSMAGDASRWIGEASAITSSQAAFTPTMRSVLINTFVVSSETIRRHLDERMRNLSAFLGSSEPVPLSGDNSMNLDPQFVLYESLCKNYQSIVPMESDNMRDISNDILRRCEGVADANLAKAMIFGKPWSSYQTLLKSYITVMIECALQNPPMVFMDDLGKDVSFNPIVHRDWGQSIAMSRGDTCSIVFPTLLPQRERQQSTYKIGVIRVPT